ncbi:MAG: trehalose-phosphatase [Chloroflexota bacterium]|nr:trehalose-phosphatase [Chloroflexota bacterium]
MNDRDGVTAEAVAARLVGAHRAGERVGVITDIDGTISRIAPSPDAAIVDPICRAALASLSGRLTLVAALTGRAALDAHRKVGLDALVYVGNHGYECWTAGTIAYIPGANAARPALQRVIAAIAPLLLPGMLIEDKGATLSIHYRAAVDSTAVESMFAPLIARQCRENGLSQFAGRKVFEVRPALQVDKGTGLSALVEDYALTACVFLGDDVTDVDAMRVTAHLRADSRCESYAIGVTAADGETPASVLASADTLVVGVEGVADWLTDLSQAISAS